VSVVGFNNVAAVDNVGRKPVIVNIFVNDVRHFFFYGNTMKNKITVGLLINNFSLFTLGRLF